MHLLNGLREIGIVDVLYLHAPGDKDASADSLSEVRPLASWSSQLELSDWIQSGERWPWMSWRTAQAMNIATGVCHEAPTISRTTSDIIKNALPRKVYDTVVAGRLPCAVIVDTLMRRGIIETDKKVVDLDDIMSRFKERELHAEAARQGKLWSISLRVDIGRVRRAEARIARSWTAASLCSHDDVSLFNRIYPNANVVRVPNVIDRAPLAVPTGATGRRLLFVGSLAFRANVAGLRAFARDAWPRILAAIPGVSLDVVGMLPPAGLKEELEALDINVHANVPSVEPFYQNADIVISPILFGGGTRIKILEAMAYGRPIVSTAIGAEGLELEPGRHALIADSMAEFACAVIDLSKDAELRERLSSEARALQQREYGPSVMQAALIQMLDC